MIASLFALAAASVPPIAGAVVIDDKATLRWQSDHREIALFGANYCLPTALDYRAAGYVGADRKALVRQDMAHFQRMGWDALRLSFWGDWEATDRDGNYSEIAWGPYTDYARASGGLGGGNVTYIGKHYAATRADRGGFFGDRINAAWADGHAGSLKWGTTRPHMWSIQDDKDKWTNTGIR